jgi:tellurite resistance protein TehA-like permease
MYWSMVFPLGMYTVATYRLSLAADVAFLRAIPQVTLWAAMSVWCVTTLGLARSLLRAGRHALAADGEPPIFGYDRAELTGTESRSAP